MQNFEKFLRILDTLNLNPEQYMISGSGSLAVRGLRDCVDLDVLVTDELGEKLKEKYPTHFHEYDFCDTLDFDGVDIRWNIKEKDRPYSTEYQIENADIIEGRKYQPLSMIKFYKQRMGRPKDIADIELIETYEHLL